MHYDISGASVVVVVVVVVVRSCSFVCNNLRVPSKTMTTSMMSSLPSLRDSESLSLLGIKKDEGPCPSMTMTQRLIGCAVCLALGYILSIGGLFRVVSLLKGNPRPFVIFTTIGTVLSLSAACFLAGPAKQMKQMLDPKRRVVSVTLFACIGTTLALVWFGGSLPGQGGILLLLCGVQLAAQAFYIFSYVPYSDKILERVWKWCASLGDR